MNKNGRLNTFCKTLLLAFLPAFSFAQPAQTPEMKITGVWKGEFYVDSTKMYYPFELTISEEKGKYTGYSRIAFEEKGIRQVVFRDHKIKVNGNEIIIEDDNQISKASSVSQPKEVKKTMLLTLTSGDSTQQLAGTWSTNRTRRYLAATGSVSMQQKKEYKSTEIFKKLEELSLTDKLSFTKEPTPEETFIRFEKQILTNLSKQELPRKKTGPPSAIIKPNPAIKPKDIPLAVVQPKPAPPPVVVAKPVTPAPVVKPVPQPAVKPKEVVVVKADKPQPKPVVKANPPAAPVAASPVRQNIPLPDIGNAATDVSKRTISNEQALYYSADSLQLTLYDNGEIDGDTVSVLLNGKVIIPKKGLDTKPNSFTVYFDRNTPDSQMLVMYAENLGAIPPNTGLLVVREGNSVYELRFSADLKTNAAIVLRRKK